jgi:putative ABC transport system permease protein
VPFVARIASLWRNLTRRRRVEQDLNDELHGFVELLTSEKIRAGLSPEAARRVGLVELGGVEQVKVRVREGRSGAGLEAVVQDVRYGVRGLVRSPGFTLVATLTLALGIGANTSIFSLINAVLLRPLPFAEPDRLVRVYERREHRGDRGEVSAHEFIAWRAGNRSLAGMALYTYGELNLTGGGEPKSITAMLVSAEFFSVLGTHPLAGRGFVAGEDRDSANHVVVLSAALWHSRFGSDSAVVGRQVVLNDVSYRVVGVMPPLGTFDPALWVPMDVPAEAQRVGRHSNYVVARLDAGMTIAGAESDLARISHRLEQELPDANTGHGVHVVSQFEDTVQDARRPVLVALGAVAFVLLIACVNVAHLLLKRGAVRQKEFAVRMALGASRRRLMAQLLTESVVLSALGGALGSMLAVWAVRWLPAIQAVQIPRLAEVRIDGRVLAVTLGLSVLSGIVSGVAPALQATRPALREWMGEGMRTTAGVNGRLAGGLVASEVALALTLLIGAGLMIRSFARLVHVDPGFDPRGVLAVALSLPASRYPGAAQQAEAIDGLVSRMRSLPGVRSVAASTSVPLGGCCNNNPISVEGQPPPRPGAEQTAVLNIVTPEYFRTMGIALRSGRPFAASDARIAQPLIRYWDQEPYPPRFNEPQPMPVAIVSETMARQFWPGEDPVGRRFRVLFSPWITVVGVAADVRHISLGGPPPADMYLAQSQEPNGSIALVLRTAGDPMRLAGPVRREIGAFDKDLPIETMVSMDQVLSDSVGRPRFNALVLGIFGAVALLLSVVGTYGVIAYGVAQRTHEIGIRAALGAQSRDLLRLVLGHALALTLTGIGIGLIGALALTRLLAALLYDVAPTDAPTYISVSALLLGVSAVASWVPTRRAMRVDPLVALRD